LLARGKARHGKEEEEEEEKGERTKRGKDERAVRVTGQKRNAPKCGGSEGRITHDAPGASMVAQGVIKSLEFTISQSPVSRERSDAPCAATMMQDEELEVSHLAKTEPHNPSS
jgi:hypothetical protein